MARKSESVHVKSTEVWTVKQGTKKVLVVKAAVRVRKGASGPGVNRPGTFQGATNFRLGKVNGEPQA